ncbi:MAG TPA: lysophospholipid acyltransferase family protein [Vicinamibacteria bacterium]
MTRERRFALEARVAEIVSSVVRRLPRRLALALGRGLGRVWADLDPRHVHIAVDNLRHAFPDWDEPRLLRTARGVYAHFGQVIFDILWMQHRPPAEILALVDVEGREILGKALLERRGVVMATGHIGNWELSGLLLGWLFEPVGVVARPLDNPALDERLVAFRARSGNSVIYKRNALGAVLRMLRDGKGVALVVDQNVQADEGIFVDFFGRKAAATTVAAALALRLEAPVVGGWVDLRPDGRYVLRFYSVSSRPGAERTAEVERLTQEINHLIETWVRSAPEQWLWLHRRWKTRPPEELAERAG